MAIVPVDNEGTIELFLHLCTRRRGQIPRGHGFGSSIIQHSIPHELGGEADVLFEPERLVARFALPTDHIAAVRSLAESEDAQGAEDVPTECDDILTGDVMIIEDNMIIAMERGLVLPGA